MPYGENSRTFIDEIVVFTRKNAPLIGVQSWKDVKDDVKIAIVDEMLVSQIGVRLLQPRFPGSFLSLFLEAVIYFWHI